MITYKLHKSRIDKISDKVIDDNVLLTVTDHDFIRYTLGFMVGKTVGKHNLTADNSIIHASTDDVTLDLGATKIRYYITEN